MKYRVYWSLVNGLTPAPALAFPPAPDGSPDPSNDNHLIDLWLSLKVSPHTRRAYASDIARILKFTGKSLSWLTLADVQAYAGKLDEEGLKPATQNRALTAVKSLLSFGQETGYLPFNVGAAVKLRPNRDSLAQRILEESEVAKLIEAAPEGRDRMLLKLLYVFNKLRRTAESLPQSCVAY